MTIYGLEDGSSTSEMERYFAPRNIAHTCYSVQSPSRLLRTGKKLIGTWSWSLVSPSSGRRKTYENFNQ